MTITLEEAAFGYEKEINISRIEHCSLCQGTGCKPDNQPSRCPDCDGTGQAHRIQQSIFGRFTTTATCPKCHGEGRIITDPCPQCRGTGQEKCQRSILIKIPAGVDDGSQIRLSGEGQSGTRGGPSGNLYVAVSIAKHDVFQRYDDNILYELPINFTQAALGAEVDVPTLDNNLKLKIPAGSQTGTVFQLKGKGIPHLHKRGNGDQLVKLLIVTPNSLTKHQRQLFQELNDTLTPPKGSRQES
jgi:molecular chaperone DnaJ